MITVKSGVRPEEVRQSARHVLFVEGHDRTAIDPVVLGEFFQDAIRVEPLGSCFSICSAAEALFAYHPDYYFLVDRDHHEDAFVNECWHNFPSAEKWNLLMWPRRELESYFLIPEYLCRSTYKRKSDDQFQRTVLRYAQERLYLETANAVIVSVRERLKTKWIETFSNPADFPSAKQAVKRLTSAAEFESHRKKTSETLKQTCLKEMYRAKLTELTGDRAALEFGAGKWLELLPGKKILSAIISECFEVVDTKGKKLNGSVKLHEVVKDLMRRPLSEQPNDFQRLHKLITDRVAAA